MSADLPDVFPNGILLTKGMNLTGKVAIVTGGAQGLGCAVVERFSRRRPEVLLPPMSMKG